MKRSNFYRFGHGLELAQEWPQDFHVFMDTVLLCSCVTLLHLCIVTTSTNMNTKVCSTLGWLRNIIPRPDLSKQAE